LYKYGEELLTFAEFERVPSSNNRAEREIRPAVLMRKASAEGELRESERARGVLMRECRTLKNRGLDPFQTILDALRNYATTGTFPPLPGRDRSKGWSVAVQVSDVVGLRCGRCLFSPCIRAQTCLWVQTMLLSYDERELPAPKSRGKLGGTAPRHAVRIVVITPPYFLLTGPVAGPAILTAALRAAGHDAIAFDVNRFCLERLLTPAGLEPALAAPPPS
jgi:hypothetical protein